jgi:hypothetical protein
MNARHTVNNHTRRRRYSGNLRPSDANSFRYWRWTITKVQNGAVVANVAALDSFVTYCSHQTMSGLMKAYSAKIATAIQKTIMK